MPASIQLDRRARTHARTLDFLDEDAFRLVVPLPDEGDVDTTPLAAAQAAPPPALKVPLLAPLPLLVVALF